MSTTQQMTTVDQAIVKVGRRFSRIRAVADLTFAQEKLHVLALIKRDRSLREARPDTIHDAMLQAASMGLSYNPTLGHCYMIGRRARKRQQGEPDQEYKKSVAIIAYASPSYRGLIHIPVMAGAIRFARAEVVYDTDHLVYRGPHHDVEYELKTTHTRMVERNAVGVFAIARIPQGDYLSEYMPRETVLRIRGMSELPNSAMWHPDKLWTEGWKKAVLRRLYKTLPNAPVTLTTAMDVLNEHEGLDPVNLRRQEATGEPAPEAVVLVNEEQITALHAVITDAGGSGDYADKQLIRLAATYEVNAITDLPVSKFTEALEKVRRGLEGRK